MNSKKVSIAMKTVKETLQQSDELYQAYENNAVRLDTLMSRIDDVQEKDSQMAKTSVSFLTKIKQWLSYSSMQTSWQLRYAVMVMAIILSAQSIYIASQSATEKNIYQAASGDSLVQQAEIPNTYLVIFSPSAQIKSINLLLAQTNAQILKGPESGTAYTVGFVDKPPAEVLLRYESSDWVEFFGEIE